METLNFNHNQIIGAEELKTWDLSLREILSNVLIHSGGSEGAGILDELSESNVFANDYFKVTIGSLPVNGVDSIKINAGYSILNTQKGMSSKIPGLVVNNDSIYKSGIALFKWDEKDNIASNTHSYPEGTIIELGFVPIINPMEVGICSVTNTNQVTISGGDFNKLRDHTYKNPSKVRFYNEDGTAAMNGQVYEVVSKLNSTTMMISGSLVNEGNLRMVIVGSYDLSVYGDLDNKTAYYVVTGELQYLVKDDSGVDSIKDKGGFHIADLTVGANGSFTITDRRDGNLYKFAVSSDTMYKSVTQVITGEKTFKTAPPKFAVPIIEVLEPTSKAVPLQIVSPAIWSFYDKVLTIPADKDGGIFTVTATEYEFYLGRIVFEGGYTPGTKFYLRLDPNSTKDLIIKSYMGLPGVIIPNDLTNGIKTVTSVGELMSITVRAGAILELIADEDLIWHILNTNSASQGGSTWTDLGLKDDLNNSAGSAFYKKDNNVVYIHLVSILSSVTNTVTFMLPDNCKPAFPTFFKIVRAGTTYEVSISESGYGLINISGVASGVGVQFSFHI